MSVTLIQEREEKILSIQISQSNLCINFNPAQLLLWALLVVFIFLVFMLLCLQHSGEDDAEKIMNKKTV